MFRAQSAYMLLCYPLRADNGIRPLWIAICSAPRRLQCRARSLRSFFLPSSTHHECCELTSLPSLTDLLPSALLLLSLPTQHHHHHHFLSSLLPSPLLLRPLFDLRTIPPPLPRPLPRLPARHGTHPALPLRRRHQGRARVRGGQRRGGELGGVLEFGFCVDEGADICVAIASVHV